MNTLKKIIWLECCNQYEKATRMKMEAPEEVYQDLVFPYIKFKEEFEEIMFNLEINY